MFAKLKIIHKAKHEQLLRENEDKSIRLQNATNSSRRRLVAVATMYECLAWHHKDISWAQHQYSSFKLKLVTKRQIENDFLLLALWGAGLAQ
jgi:hypothetical protein